MTRNACILLLILMLVHASVAAQPHPAFPKTAADPRAFVPPGWKVINQAKGDLNKDNMGDEALIIQNTDPRNILLNLHGLGADSLDVNPRILLILFKDKTSGYRLAEENRTFIPSPNDSSSTCLADPLMETEGLTINKGVLILHYQYWTSCGSWYTSNHDYVFRYQNNRFELIGFDCREYHRASGETNVYSVNFSTKKYSHTTGGSMFEDTEEKPQTAWKTLKLTKMIPLKEMNRDTFSDRILKLIED